MSTDTPLIESMLLAASLPDAEISARVANLRPGYRRRGDAGRGGLLNGPQLKFVIQCDPGFGDERLGYLFTLGDGAPHVEKGWDGEAAATVRARHKSRRLLLQPVVRTA
jgi:hypothetical protein